MANSRVNLYNFGTNYSSEYKIFGDNVLSNCENTLLKSGIFPQKAINPPLEQEPIKGLTVEKSQNNDDTDTDENNTDDETKKKDNTQYNKETQYKISNSKNVVNSSYTKLTNKEQTLSTKDNLTYKENSALRDIDETVNVCDDIENVGKEHLARLTEELPEHGNISGGAYYSADKDDETITNEYQLNFKNTWQNKSKNFGIVFSTQFGAKNTIINSGDESDAFDFDIDDDDETDNNSTNTDTEDVPTDLFKKEISGNVSISTRYDAGRLLIGGGIDYNRYNKQTQITDIYASAIDKHSGIGGDLTRRMTISTDASTGERTLKSEMKLKIDIINNKANYDEDDDNTTTNTNVNENESSNEPNPDDDSYRTDTKSIRISSSGESLNNEVNEDNEKLQQFNKKKDGTGLDLDFEYDSSKCGLLGKYGFNIINDNDGKAIVQASPIFGLYDYNSPADDNEEALKITAGGLIELNKEFSNGSMLQGSGSVIYTRIMETGYSPKNTAYALLNISYDNPKKKIYLGLDAAYIKSNIDIRYVNANVNKDFKNVNLRLNAGISNVNGYAENCTDYQISAQVTYTIPYGDKKKN